MNHNQLNSALPKTSPSSENLKLSRRASRQHGLFEPQLMQEALKQSFLMLRPDIQWKNPVMFVVWVGTILTFIYTIAEIAGYRSQVSLSYLIGLDFWLFLTLLFANFASALAEARGKAQADTLRKTRRETPARIIRRYDPLKPYLREASRNGLDQAHQSNSHRIGHQFLNIGVRKRRY